MRSLLSTFLFICCLLFISSAYVSAQTLKDPPPRLITNGQFRIDCDQRLETEEHLVCHRPYLEISNSAPSETQKFYFVSSDTRFPQMLREVRYISPDDAEICRELGRETPSTGLFVKTTNFDLALFMRERAGLAMIWSHNTVIVQDDVPTLQRWAYKSPFKNDFPVIEIQHCGRPLR